MASNPMAVSLKAVQHRSASFVYCLSCGERLADRSVLREPRMALWSRVDSDDGGVPIKPYLRCAHCGANNFLINEYAYGRPFWRLSYWRFGESGQA